MAAKNKMEEKKHYRVVYTDQDDNEREFVASYLGQGPSGDHDFDLNPAAGTLSVADGSIKSFDLVEEDEKSKKPKAVKS